MSNCQPPQKKINILSITLQLKTEDGDEDGGGFVRFNVEGEEEAVEGDFGEDRMRLHRRDTPHHLKNKRINQQVRDWSF